MSNKEQVSVIIDSNEESQNIETVELFVMHEDVEDFSIEPLETGDFIIEDCIFERKTASDFAGSLKKGRLREQVERMQQSGKRGFVLVEGDMSDFSNLEHSKMPAKSLRGMTASIIGRHGIPVVFCSEPKYLADIAIRIARKTIEDPSEIHVSNANTVKEVPFMVKFFMNFEGIGIETAEKLAGQFTSVQSVLEAELDDFKIVDGIGDKTAKNILDTLDTGFDETEEEESGVTTIRV